MRTSINKNSVSRNGVAEEGSFQIKATGKAFKILSDGLYSDKVLAVVRELSCNAFDAHISAGKPDVPFEVHLPNSIEPFFSVKDFGIGLNHEDVTHLYTTYFESTKGDSDDFIGALGLGSKSPFSYVDSFTVTSRFEGIKRLYTSFISENGVPSIAFMGEETTDECNGLEVSMPVKEEDFSRFREKTEKALYFFKVRPTVNGNTSFNIKDISYILEGSNWKIREIKDSYYNRGLEAQPVALQGAVAYVINPDSIPDITKTEKAVLKLPIELYFDIGQLEVAASRESLSYDKRTIENIKNSLNDVADKIQEKLSSSITDCKTEWEACIMFKKVMRDHDSFREFLKTAQGTYSPTIIWHGKTLDGEIELPMKTPRFTDINVNAYRRSGRNNRRVSAIMGRGGRQGSQSAFGISIPVSEKLEFFIDDLKTGGVGRIRQHILSLGHHNEVYLLRHDLNKSNPKKALRDMRAFLKKAGGIKFSYTSSLDKVVGSNNGVKKPVALFVWTGKKEKPSEYSRYDYNKPAARDNWAESELDINDFKPKERVYYIDLRFYTPYNIDGNYIAQERFQGAINRSITLGIFGRGKTLLGLRSSAKKEMLKKGVDLVNVLWYIEHTLKDKLPKVYPKIHRIQELETFESMIYNDWNNWNQKRNVKNLNSKLVKDIPNHNVVKFWDKIERVRLAKEKFDFKSWQKLEKFFDIEKDPSIKLKNYSGFWKKEWEGILKKYPILKIVDLYSASDENVNIIISYLQEK